MTKRDKQRELDEKHFWTAFPVNNVKNGGSKKMYFIEILAIRHLNASEKFHLEKM